MSSQDLVKVEGATANAGLKLRFDLTTATLETETTRIMEESKNLLDKIVKDTASTIANLKSAADVKFEDSPLQALADEDAFFTTQFSNCYFPSQVSADAQLREASVAANQKLEAYSIEKDLRADVYKAVKDYLDHVSSLANAREANQTYKNLFNTEQNYFIYKVMLNFERNGFQLPQDKQNALKKLRQDMSELSIQFQTNMNEDNTSLLFTKEELSGMPESYLEGLTKDEETGKYKVSLQYPDYFPLVKKCSVEETRKKMLIAKESQCQDKNVPIFEKIIRLRQDEADLLGFENHAAFTLAPRMARDVTTVFDFLSRLSARLAPALEKDLKDLLALKEEYCKKNNRAFDKTLHAWDWRFYQNLLLEEHYSIDEEAIAQYFPMDYVVKNSLKLFEDIMSLRFTQIPAAEARTWHADVTQYQVHDKESGSFIGYFFLDLFPRQGKYGHAAEFGLQKACLLKGSTRQVPAAAMVANFTKPTPDKPSLLRFDEVVTFLHEFGHVTHELLACSSYSPLSGTNVQRDFVEAPSQMLENWCYEKDTMLRVSKHWQTGNVLPDEQIEKLIKAKNATIGLLLRRQLFFATFDMTIHTLPKDQLATLDSAKLWHSLSDSLMGIKLPEGTNGVGSFGHLVGGYSAGYYGYLWSEVYSSDMYKHFQSKGIFDEATGKKYRDVVLAPGGSRDAMDLLVEFLGRKPTEDAFLEHIGIVQTADH
jgi:Zn-dependent oligopeptidase